MKKTTKSASSSKPQSQKGEEKSQVKRKQKPQKPFTETKTVTVDYFPRGGNLPEPVKGKVKSKKLDVKEAGEPEFVFNKAPVQMVKRKKRSPFEMSIPELPEKKKKVASSAEEAEEDAEMVEGQLEPAKPRRGASDVSMADLTRIRRLKVQRGCLLLASVLEVTKYYLIVSYGRNKKGYISAADLTEYGTGMIDRFRPGDFIPCTVVQGEGTDYRKESGNLNRKMQLTINPHVFNACLNAEVVQPGIILPGSIESVEEKGYLVNFGLSDGAQGFVRFEDCPAEAKYVEKQWVLLTVTSVNKKTKVINCVPLGKGEHKPVGYNEKVSMETIKPGCLVQAVVKQVLLNGVYVQFLRGLEGTVFVDHLAKPLTKYTKGEKMMLRIVLVDLQNKVVSLSEKEHLVKLAPFRSLPVKIGTIIPEGKVSSEAYGGSYFVSVSSPVPLTVFLHKSHVGDPASEESLKAGTVVKNITLKEFNYFDGNYIGSLDTPAPETITWQNVEVGQFVTGNTEKVVTDPKKGTFVLVKLNQFVSGIVPLEHTADRPIAHVPEKMAQPGKTLKLRVFSINRLTKTLILTKKKTLLKTDTPTILNREDAEVGKEVYGVVGKAVEGGVIIKFFNDIAGFLSNDEVPQDKPLKTGQTVKVVVGYNNLKQKKIGLALTAEGAKKLSTKQASLSDDIKQIFANVKADVNIELPEETRSSLAVGQIYEFKPISAESESDLKHDPENYLLFKTAGLTHNFYVYVPKYHLSDYKQHNDKFFELISQGFCTEKSFKGVILNILEPHNIVIVSLKSSLVRAKENSILPAEFEDFNENEVYYGFIGSIVEKGVFVHFLGNLKAFLSNAELENSYEKAKICWVGKPLRVTVVRINREDQNVYLSTKLGKVYPGFGTTGKDQRGVQRKVMAELKDGIVQFYDEMNYIEDCYAKKGNLAEVWKTVHYGDYVKGSVQMIKEYGVIIQTDNKELTGFIMSENKRKKDYEVGQEVTAKILDIDKERKLLDLSHGKHFMELAKQPSPKPSPATCQHPNLLPSILPHITKFPKAKPVKARVELVKEAYAVVSFPAQSYLVALVPIRLFNHDEKEALLNKLSIGHILSVKVCGYSESHQVLFAVPALTNLRKIWDTDQETATEETGARKMSDIELDIQSLAVGQKITGKVSSIQGFTAFVHVNRKVCGRLHKAQCGTEAKFGELRKGATVIGYIINIAKDDSKGTCKLDLALNEGAGLSQVAKGDKLAGVIRMIQWSSSFPIVVELSGYAKASVYFTDLVKDAKDLESLRSKLKEGSIVSCYSLFETASLATAAERLKVSLCPADPEKSTSIKPGDLVVCRCIKGKDGHGMAVQLTEKITGIIDITELSDDFTTNPFASIGKRGVFAARVLEVSPGKMTDQEKYVLSARGSLLDEKLWRILQNGTTAEFQKHFEYVTEEGDLRSKIVKFGTEWIQHGMIGLGYVSNINDKGCFIKVSHKLTVRASLRELTDLEVVNPVALYKPNDLVLFRITSIVEPKKPHPTAQKYFNVSLRESIIKYGLNVGLKDLKPGLTCQAIVRKKEESTQLWVQIKGSTLLGVVKGAPEDVVEGELINCTVQKVDIVEGENKAKIKLKYESKVDTSAEPTKIEELYQKIMSPYKATATETMKDIATNQPIEVAEQHGPELTLKPDELEILQEVEEGKAEGENVIQETMHDEEPEASPEEDQKEEEEPVEKIAENPEVESDSEKPEVEEEKGEPMEIEEKKPAEEEEKKPVHLKEKIKKEKQIRKIEKEGLKEAQPKSVEEFEKSVIAEPNSSFVWLQYVAFMLDNAGIESARRILERAIKGIAPDREQDKLNLWIGYLNLESTYGTTETLQKVAERAAEVNDKKKIYDALAGIYFASKRFEFALDVHKLMVKKFFADISVWSRYIDTLFQLEKIKADPAHADHEAVSKLEYIAPREALSRALQALDKKSHVDMIAKYGQQEYKYGNIESGRTMFEGVVSSYPKRTDIWGVYLDMEIKYGKNNKEYVRGMFEKCLKLGLKDKKMMFFFKKYLDYELAYGSEATVDAVKKKAEEYVKSKQGGLGKAE